MTLQRNLISLKRYLKVSSNEIDFIYTFEKVVSKSKDAVMLLLYGLEH